MFIRTSKSVAALVALFVLALGARAFAQIAPNDSGLGTRLGLSQENNSGQTGWVTLFRRGNGTTLVVIKLDSETPGRSEPAHIHRGNDCDSIDPKPAYPLAPVINGNSKTIVQASEDRLLSGNYNVNVHSASHMSVYFSCGHLYR